MRQSRPKATGSSRDRTQRIPDEHSTLVPPLPIPNRAVKRCCADDSMDYPCESRSSSGPHKNKKPRPSAGAFCFVRFSDRHLCHFYRTLGIGVDIGKGAKREPRKRGSEGSHAFLLRNVTFHFSLLTRGRLGNLATWQLGRGRVPLATRASPEFGFFDKMPPG